MKEAPLNMLIAMAIAAFFCIFFGLYPAPLYALLPFEVRADPAGTAWHNYTASHVMTSLQLLLFAALAFAILFRKGWYPDEIKAVNVDSDVVYRKLAPWLVRLVGRLIGRVTDGTIAAAKQAIGWVLTRVGRLHRPGGRIGEPWATGEAAPWVAVVLVAYLILSYV